MKIKVYTERKEAFYLRRKSFLDFFLKISFLFFGMLILMSFNDEKNKSFFQKVYSKVKENISEKIIETADGVQVQFDATDFYASTAQMVAIDSDMDGVDDIDDLDDDNDGIPDFFEQKDSSFIFGQYDITSFTFGESNDILVTVGSDSINTDPISSGWRTKYTNEALNLPIHFEFTIEDVSSSRMIGLLPTSATEVYDNWTYEGYKFFISGTSNIRVRIDGGPNEISVPYSSGILHEIDIDEQGNVFFSIGGTIVFSTVGAPLTSYKLAISSGNNVARSINNIVLLEESNFQRVGIDLDSDNDGTPNRLDLDSDGDGCYDAYEATAITNPSDSLAATSAADVGANGLADILETFVDSDTVNYDLQFEDLRNSDLNRCGPEICNDGLDNNRDGYIDNYELDCNPNGLPDCIGVAPTANVAVERQACTSTGGYTAYQTPMVADIDFDGMPEIIAGIGDGADSIVILNSVTLEVETGFPVESGIIDGKWNAVGVAQLDGAGYLEVAYVTSSDRLLVKRYNGSTWEHFESEEIPSPVMNTGGGQTNGGVSFADFNSDGIPEIYIGNQIYNVDFACTTQPCINTTINGQGIGMASGDNGTNTGAFSVAYDILDRFDCGGDPDCDGLEIIAGFQVYSVNLSTGDVKIQKDLQVITGNNSYLDGPTGIADMDLDGNIDIVVNCRNSIYIWDPVKEIVINEWARPPGNLSLPVIADIYNDDLADDNMLNNSIANVPEVTVLIGSDLTTFNVTSNSSIWVLATSDGSGATALTAFDFNGDGFQELVYRDQISLRIMYGGPAAFTPPGVDAERNYETFSCTSATGWEHPVVADTDNDGQAEIVVSCDPDICVYESGTAPWQPARPIWNQFSYYNVNVNDDGTIPIVQQDLLSPLPRPEGSLTLNSFGNQLNPMRLVAGPDTVFLANATLSLDSIVVSCPEATLHFAITNNGAANYPPGTVAAVYNGNPTTAGTSLLHTFTTDALVEIDSTVTFTESFTLPNDVTPSMNIFLMLNDTGFVTSLPFDINTDFPVTGLVECDYNDNLGGLTISCPDNDMDNIPDFVDIDDDNDGILDTTECGSLIAKFAEISSWDNGTGIITGVLADGITYSGQIISGTIDINNMTTDNTSLLFSHANIYLPESNTDAIGVEISSSEAIYEWTFSQPVSDLRLNIDGLDFRRLTISGTGVTGLEELAGSPENQLDDLTIYDLNEASNHVADNDSYNNQSAQGTFLIRGTYSTLRFSYSLNGGNTAPDSHVYQFSVSALFCDSDSDGIPNHLDLDSDGNGCYDALEASVPGATLDGSVTDSLAATSAAEVGANGFANTLESDDTQSATANYTPTYAQAIDGLGSCNQRPTIAPPTTATFAENDTGLVYNTESTDDADAENSGLTYAFTGDGTNSPDESIFNIDPITGEITFVASPDFETPTDANTDNVYQIEVQVCDSGSLCDTEIISITVTDVDEDGDGLVGAADPDDLDPCVPDNTNTNCCEADAPVITKD